MLKAYLELFRLPNVFTAMACLSMGFLVTNEPPARLGHYLLLLAASSLIYTAGMVLNDVFDLEVDLLERPDRPLPSGRIPVGRAIRLGFGLLLVGLAAACVAGYLAGDKRPALVAMVLCAAVLAYDRSLKNTPIGPLAMGCCRALNVLLGMSLAAGPWEDWHYAIAGGIGLYITGVTWFARSEAANSERAQLAVALVVMLAGLGMLAYYPQLEPPDLEDVLRVDRQRWYFLWLALGLMTTWRCPAGDHRSECGARAVRSQALPVVTDRARRGDLHGGAPARLVGADSRSAAASDVSRPLDLLHLAESISGATASEVGRADCISRPTPLRFAGRGTRKLFVDIVLVGAEAL